MISRTLFVRTLVLTLTLLTLIILSSCYNQKKAQQQFGKAAVTYPIIPAEYCAVTFPPKDKIIKGDSIITFDTIYVEKEDTTFREDTLIYNGIKVPASEWETPYEFNAAPIITKYITKTIRITDTIYQTDNAALKAAQIKRDEAQTLLVKKTSEYDKVKKNRDWWRIVAICCMAVIGIGLFFKIKNAFVPLK